MTTKLKITAIKPYPVWVGTRNQMLVKVETDNGIFGWGESGLSGRERPWPARSSTIVSFSSAAIRCRLVGSGKKFIAANTSRAGAFCRRRFPPSTLRFTTSRARRWACRPELLGGKQRDRIPTFASTGDEAEGDVAIERARELRAQGWKAIRFFPVGQNSKDIFEPRESIGATATILNKAREALGDEVVLGIDYHHRLSVAEAASFCNKLGRGVLDFLEEPIRDETPEAYRSCAR